MSYTTEEKLQLECKKLEEEVKKLAVEVRNIQVPFLRQPSTMWGAIPLLISIVLNLQQCSKTKQAEQLSAIKLERATLATERTKKETDSLEKRKAELDAQITLAQSQLQNTSDSVGKASEQIRKLIATAPSTDQTKTALDGIQSTVDNVVQMSKYAAANIAMNGSSFKVSAIKNDQLARQKWKDGFAALVNNNIDEAVSDFTQSENAYNGYHHAYELARYLRSKVEGASNLDVRKEIIKKVLSEYSGFAPKESIEALKIELNK